jgi:hypothetical protein
MNKLNLKSFALGVSVAVSALGIYALAMSIPNTFSAGTSISSGQVNANFTAVKTAVDALAAKFPVSAANLAAPAAFTIAALLNGWTGGEFGSNPTGFYKDLEGNVHLQGSLKGGTNNTVAFVLPAGFRPTGSLYIAAYTYQGSVGALEILPDGRVTPFGAQVTNYTSFENISFRAAL